MAITSSPTSTSSAGSTLDVAGIVRGLMEAESVPVNKLEAKLSKSSVKITALGAIKGQLSSFKSSLIELQTPANFSKQSAKFSNTSVATAEITSLTATASYQMEVASLAQPTIWNVSGFSSSTNALAWFNASPEQDELRTKADATVFQSSSGEYVLSLKSKTTGTEGTFSLEGNFVAAGITKTQYQSAQNAIFKLNGVEFTRSSNTVSDAISGITLNLSSTTAIAAPISLTVANESVPLRPKLDAFVKAFNDLNAMYKLQTNSSIDIASRGVLNSDFGVASMMRQLVSGLILPVTNLNGGAFTDTSQNDLSAMGLELLDNGNLAVDEALLSAASSTLQTRLAAGIRIGYSILSRSDLATQIGSMLLSGGVIQDRIDSETNTQSDLNKRKTALQEKLIGVQARYTAQYASLDALLFKLQGTSDSLKSALDGLTNSQKNG